ncbi:flagellar basal-body rod protein FlgB [Breoghania sp.]|uniref:flagellar basal-body rod protein FlgB n=1 Tax=Breoghania sp. TaxID=2065378 RepID=UPI002617D18C|nr:flagellar basal-body rod protein FlgB [Breoghania sp.]MDJ0932077.1 flagellar basal-body rod protein FlgB [Breoghania sp.]
MGISDISVFQALKTKMQWHQERQGILSENVANAGAPGYLGQDLKAPKFNDSLNDTGVEPVVQAVTEPGHMRAFSSRGFGDGKKVGSFEVTPDDNSVVLEEQMMKVTANQMDYQAATTLYSRGLGLLKTAIGKN